MYNIQCTMYNVQRTKCNVPFKFIHIELCSTYLVSCNMYTELCWLSVVNCPRYIVRCLRLVVHLSKAFRPSPVHGQVDPIYIAGSRAGEKCDSSCDFFGRSESFHRYLFYRFCFEYGLIHI